MKIKISIITESDGTEHETESEELNDIDSAIAWLGSAERSFARAEAQAEAILEDTEDNL